MELINKKQKPIDMSIRIPRKEYAAIVKLAKYLSLQPSSYVRSLAVRALHQDWNVYINKGHSKSVPVKEKPMPKQESPILNQAHSYYEPPTDEEEFADEDE